MKYILPRMQVFVSFAIKKGTKECIRVRTIHTSVLNFKAYLQIQTRFPIKIRCLEFRTFQELMFTQ